MDGKVDCYILASSPLDVHEVCDRKKSVSERRKQT